MKTILLLGDSIRMSYQQMVTDKLAGRARVVAPGGKRGICPPTAICACQVGWRNVELRILSIGTTAFGIWGCAAGATRTNFPSQDYLGNLNSILGRLRETGASIIWRTTTPVQADFPWQGEWTFCCR